MRARKVNSGFENENPRPHSGTAEGLGVMSILGDGTAPNESKLANQMFTIGKFFRAPQASLTCPDSSDHG
jgi:hypothetical protein